MTAKNWIDDVEIGQCQHGYFVRLDGSDLFEPPNVHGCKGRKTLSIAEHLATREEAKEVAIKWLRAQIEKVSA